MVRRPVLVSLLVHVGIVALLVIAPIFGPVLLPSTSSSSRIETFVLAAALPAVPPPALVRSPSPATPPSDAVPQPVPVASAAAPVDAPTGVAAGEPPAYVPGATSGGSPTSGLGGVEGGLPGPPAIGSPAPPLPPQAPRRVGGDIRAPAKLRHVAPIYPAIAAQARVTGTVILEATIAPTGEVTDVRVLRSVPLLDAAAVAAVRQWRYDPPRLNGAPIAVLLTVTVRFEH